MGKGGRGRGARRKTFGQIAIDNANREAGRVALKSSTLAAPRSSTSAVRSSSSDQINSWSRHIAQPIANGATEFEDTVLTTEARKFRIIVEHEDILRQMVRKALGGYAKLRWGRTTYSHHCRG